MNEVRLWRLLREKTLDAAAIAPMLEQLAAEPWQKKFPFLGLLPRLLFHTDPGLRAGALHVLDEADGLMALRHIVRGLDDRDGAVRSAAVEALFGFAERNDHKRWAHAVFHQNADVRQDVAGRSSFSYGKWLHLYLLADPACHDVVRANLAEVVDAPAFMLPVILDFVDRGWLPRPEAQRLVGEMDKEELLNVACGPRTPPSNHLGQVWRVVNTDDTAALTKPDPFDPFLDAVMDLFWEPAGVGAAEQGNKPSSAEILFAGLRNFLTDKKVTLATRLRTSFSIMRVAKRRQVWIQPAADCLACILPDYLTVKWIPLQVRRASIAQFYAAPINSLSAGQNIVKSILQSDVCRRASNNLDLWAAGGVLRLIKEEPLKQFVDWFPVEAIVASYLEEPVESAAFLTVKDDSDSGQVFWIRTIGAAFDPQNIHRGVALMAFRANTKWVDFLQSLGDEDLLAVYRELLHFDKSDEMSEEKVTRLVALFLLKYAKVEKLLDAWLQTAAPEKSALGVALFKTIGVGVGRMRLALAVKRSPESVTRSLIRIMESETDTPVAMKKLLAWALHDRRNAEIRQWAKANTPTPANRSEPPQPLSQVRARIIATCSKDELSYRLAACWRVPFTGLCAALESRAETENNAAVCAALLGCWDSFEKVSRQFHRFGDDDQEFIKGLDRLTEPWKGVPNLPWWGNAWLHNIEEHCLAFGDQVEDLTTVLNAVTEQPSWLLRRRTWEAAVHVVRIWREQDLQRFHRQVQRAVAGGLGDTLLKELDGLYAELAAKLLVELHAVGYLSELWRSLHKQEAWSKKDRKILERFMDVDDLPVFASKPASVPVKPISKTPADTARALVLDAKAEPESRFLAGLERVSGGERDLLQSVLEAAWGDTPAPWFRPEYWQRLLDLQVPAMDLAVSLAVSAQPHACFRAVKLLLGRASRKGRDRRVAIKALVAFLESEHGHLPKLRQEVAFWLARHAKPNEDKFAGMPLLLQGAFNQDEKVNRLLRVTKIPRELAVTATTAAFLAGPGNARGEHLLRFVEWADISLRTRTELYSVLMKNSSSAEVATRAFKRFARKPHHLTTLRKLADLCAWGIRVGQELTKRILSVEFCGGEKLGFTRIKGSRIYVNPLPLLRNEPHGEDVVGGLILHELGHHCYHHGPDSQKIHEEAAKDGLAGLFNLVTDEHLERNLRAVDPKFGDKIKRLNAYAYQHTPKEFAVDYLAQFLQGQMCEVLTSCKLGVARREGCVAIENGRMLLAMEKAGLSFARFVRALRLGLGNRYKDPKVEQALHLFGRDFRLNTMRDLLAVTRLLREIFGNETLLAESLAHEERLVAEESELVDASGLSHDELLEEVDDLLGPLGGCKKRVRIEKSDLRVNRDARTDFPPITNIVKLPFDAEQQAMYARQVALHARQMRRFLTDLGLAMETQRGRIQGRTLDRSRLKAVVLRAEPRMMMTRQRQLKNDLFLGLLVDCSGSMTEENRIERAKCFGAVLAEATRGLPGIELRVFGFNDETIFEVGDAERCAVAGLTADTQRGNNDAAALWHAAQVALASHRSSRLLVAISDGMPTACSTNALKALVTRLTKRMRILCAQVAVKPLEEICFPHYVALEADNTDEAVRKFGLIINRLIRKTMKA